VVPRCVLVDDSTRFLEAARASLERGGLAVVAAVTTPGQAWDAVRDEDPDVVLVDLALGEDSGADLCRELLAAFPRLHGRIVLISTRAADDVADLVAASGAAGFIDKSVLTAEAVLGLLPG
jgi:two-component system nitrate/nitrite response regulator NarL